MPEPLLSVRDLSVSFPSKGGTIQALSGLSFDLGPGETLALVGESGCGKSTAALAVLGLLPEGARIAALRIGFEGKDLLRLPEREFRSLRGRRISIVLQEPSAALNPLLPIGAQVAEILTTHLGLSAQEARKRVLEIFARVRIPDPESKFAAYPHQLSGGLKQRSVIAAAVAAHPRLLIADEPTTALDVTVQAQILDLLRSLQEETGMSILFITHDLAVASGFARRVGVLYAGRIVEEGPAGMVLTAPRHPYTQALLAARPALPAPGGKLAEIPGAPPGAGGPVPGCAFHPRCPKRFDPCAIRLPTLLGSGSKVACHLYGEEFRVTSNES